MATTTNYGWTTPNDTDLVKDGAAAIRTLGSSIDTTVFANAGASVASTIVDAKGDIIAATAADTVARLAVGANGTILTADSAETTGLKWASPSSAAANYTLLNAGGTALTGAQTITVSGISGQNSLHIRIEGASSASGSSAIGLRINTDTGSNYLRYMLQSFPGGTYDSGALQAPAPSTATAFPIGQMPANSSNAVSGGIFIHGANSAGIKIINGLGGSNGGDNSIAWFGYGHYTGTSTISSISLFSGTGNFDAGTVFVYGSAN